MVTYRHDRCWPTAYLANNRLWSQVGNGKSKGSFNDVCDRLVVCTINCILDYTSSFSWASLGRRSVVCHL